MKSINTIRKATKSLKKVGIAWLIAASLQGCGGCGTYNQLTYNQQKQQVGTKIDSCERTVVEKHGIVPTITDTQGLEFSSTDQPSWTGDQFSEVEKSILSYPDTVAKEIKACIQKNVCPAYTETNLAETAITKDSRESAVNLEQQGKKLFINIDLSKIIVPAYFETSTFEVYILIYNKDKDIDQTFTSAGIESQNGVRKVVPRMFLGEYMTLDKGRKIENNQLTQTQIVESDINKVYVSLLFPGRLESIFRTDPLCEATRISSDPTGKDRSYDKKYDLPLTGTSSTSTEEATDTIQSIFFDINTQDLINQSNANLSYTVEVLQNSCKLKWVW